MGLGRDDKARSRGICIGYGKFHTLAGVNVLLCYHADLQGTTGPVGTGSGPGCVAPLCSGIFPVLGILYIEYKCSPLLI